MKIIFSKSVKRLSGIFVCLFLFGVILLNVVGYYFDLKYLSVLAAMAEVNKYEVRSQLLMEAMNGVGVCRPEQAVEVWANGLKMRSAAMQYSVMTKELKKQYALQLEESFPNWVTGMSSPWVESFEIIKTEKPDENSYIFNIRFFTATSTGPAGDYNAVLTVTWEGDFWRISKILTDRELYAYTGFNPNN